MGCVVRPGVGVSLVHALRGLFCRWSAEDVLETQMSTPFHKVVLVHEHVRLVFLCNFLHQTENHIVRSFGEWRGMLLQHAANANKEEMSTEDVFEFLQMNLEVKPSFTSESPLHGLIGQRARNSNGQLQPAQALEHQSEQVLSSAVDVFLGPSQVESTESAPQGEGFIAGVYQDYMEQNNDLFGCSFAYNLFDCERATIN